MSRFNKLHRVCVSWWTLQSAQRIKKPHVKTIRTILLLPCKCQVSAPQGRNRASVLHKARISVDNCGDVYRWCDCGKEGEIVTFAARECVFDVFVLAFKEKHMRTVVTKWATSRQGTEGINMQKKGIVTWVLWNFLGLISSHMYMLYRSPGFKIPYLCSACYLPPVSY